MFDVTKEQHPEFVGYGPSPIPNALDDEVRFLILSLRNAGPASIEKELSVSSEVSRQVLRAFAERMASMAVRHGDREHLFNALIANVIGGLAVDSRESLMVMAPIDDAARRIGVDFQRLLGEAAEVVGQQRGANILAWLTRADSNRSLASMRFVATADADGFRYALRW